MGCASTKHEIKEAEKVKRVSTKEVLKSLGVKSNLQFPKPPNDLRLAHKRLKKKSGLNF